MIRDLLLIVVAAAVLSGALTALAFAFWKRRLRGHPVRWLAIVRVEGIDIIGRGDTTEEAYDDLRVRLRLEDDWRLR